MLPNHAPLTGAEQFGTLATLHPGRIDFGPIGVPDTDQRTRPALGRDPASADGSRATCASCDPTPRPCSPCDVPIWLLGSSLSDVQLAAMLGLPFASASHLAPDAMMDGIAICRGRFTPFEALRQPCALLEVSVFAADADDEAAFIATSARRQMAELRLGTPGKLKPPRREDLETSAARRRSCAIVAAALTSLSVAASPNPMPRRDTAPR